ncbi:hypothetical protein [Brevibacillus laterosporus]|uniref:hypothetical protein n=1 Tax=Brevibacillus laterosporus TaxID=1465 RepID=UPI002E1CB3E7|nr:hypothetical protein [Brevibacillus laterosporus]MED1667230.1 hypothetical protein [Brevibacillus laterosporus]MED1719702.1 hypothetical protein [Brevibacillus laterosporus]
MLVDSDILIAYNSINSNKLTVKKKSRGSGKTTTIKHLLRENKNLIAIVPEIEQKRSYLPEFKGRIFAASRFDHEMRGRRLDKVVIDEGFFSTEEMLQLYYYLGKYEVKVLTVGS